MKSCVVVSHRAGLFSLINKVVLCATIYDHVHVDFSQGHEHSYKGGNLWEALFEPTIPPTGEFDTILEYPDYSITGGAAGKLYQSGDEWREKYHQAWKRFRVKPELLEAAARFALRHWGVSSDVVAVLIRCTEHSREQLSGISQPLDEYAKAFERIRKPKAILHVMSGDKESLVWFEERFPRVTYVGSVTRVPTRDIDLSLQPQTRGDAMQCLVEVLLLSRARALIHPVSNMATAALYINPQLESVYLP